MNCQEVIEILDNQKVDGLDSARRRQAEAHVAGCADCARVWHAQASLASLPDMAMPADFQAHCRAAVAARSGAGTASGRRVNRRLLWGSFAAMAAAAAMLLLKPTVQTAPEETVQVVQAEATSPVVDVASAVMPIETALPGKPETMPAIASKVVAEPRFTVRVMPPDAANAAQEARAYDNDPAAPEVMQSLRAALVTELRKIPDLAVVDQGPTKITPASRHYRLGIATLMMTGRDGRSMRKAQSYPVVLTVQELRPDGTTINRTGGVPSSAVVTPLATCSGAALDVDTFCFDVPGTAAYLVRELRKNVFPPDTSVTQPLEAALQDSSLSPEERFQAFAEIFKQQGKIEGKGLLDDESVVRAAIGLAQSSDPAHRARVWRAMRGVGDPMLIEPLLASLQQDPDEVRIAAIETLAADFDGDQRVQSALETAAVSDPRPLVRAVAQRGLTGEEGWRNYVVSSIRDAGRPDSERVEALLYELYPPPTTERYSGPSPGNYWEILTALDDATVRSLTEIFPRADVFRKGPGNNFLANFAAMHNKNPAVTDMLLTVLEQDPQPLNRGVAGQTLAASHAGEPRVRAALTKAVSNDPDASVRENLRQILESDNVKKAMGAGAQ